VLMKKYLLVLIIALASLTLQAQNEMRIVGKGEYLPSELIDKTVRDANGETCAGLIISSDLDGLRYDSYNGIVKTNPQPGEDFLFLSPDERVVTIYKSGFTSLKIIMSEYGIKLKSGEVWKLKVTGDKKTDQIPITITTNAEGASFTIDGFDKGVEKTQWVSLGKHKLIIAKAGFKTDTTEIEVTEKNVSFNFQLEKIRPVKVTIKTIPTGAKIFVKEIEKGESDYQFFELPGKYTVKLSKLGFIDLSKEIEIKETGTNEFTFQLSRNRGILMLNVDVADAIIKLDGEPVNKRELELAPKSYDLEISRSGYFSVYEKIDIKLGETVTKNYTLVKNTVLLTLEIDPADASVAINSKNYSGQKTIELAQGSYIIEIEKEGYKKQEIDVTLELNKPVAKKIKLEPRTGSLQFTVKPIAADVELYKNNKIISKWSGANLVTDLLIGEYKINAKLNGYTTEERNVTITEANETKIDINLITDIQTGVVDINVSPLQASDAQIYLNDVFKGNAPLSISLMPGYYNVMAKKYGYQDVAKDVTLQKNGSEKILLNMKPVLSDAATKNRTWNWITTGLAVVGGAVALYYYSDTKSNYDSYKTATTPTTAKDLRAKTEAGAKMFNITFSVSAASLVTTAILWFAN